VESPTPSFPVQPFPSGKCPETVGWFLLYRKRASCLRLAVLRADTT
jgi:hypothetical protein